MCGLAGIISNNPALVSKQRIEEAISCLIHRGPDGSGAWINTTNKVAFGHRRLSVIDLAPQASQPFLYRNRYSIIHNGELYNYLEIKKQLQQKGYVFTTASDTEVIVAAYDAYKEECLQTFDGMFAFAIWDEVEQKLFAARDRFGEKPFFFFLNDEQFLFASELKSLWQLGVKKEVNHAMLYNFLTIGYTSNPGDPTETFYQNVQKLPVASYLTWTSSSNQVELTKYWQLHSEIDNSISETKAIEKFVELFSESVRRRLRSDVPIGTSLSGGLDSSSIVAICDKVSSDHYTHKCFTASFKGFEKDELQFAKLVAEKFKLEHHIVEMAEGGLVGLMNKVMKHQEEPFSSASVLAQYKVFETAKQNGVTVLLDGQGADEVLAGYHKYYRWYWQELYRTNKKDFQKEYRAAKELGVKETFTLKNKLATRFPDFAFGLLQTRKSKSAFQHRDLNREFAFSNKQNFYYSTPSGFNLNAALYFNSFVTGLEELLRLADRNSMAHGTEVRLPFLSHDLVSFLFTLPAHFKIHQGWTKWILRKSMESRVPSEIVWRKDKTGFEPPQKKWMGNSEVQQAIMHGKEMLVSKNILQASVLKKKIRPHDAYSADASEWKCWSASYLFE